MIYNDFFHILFENPLKTWWKARKYFAFPDVKCKFNFVYHLSKMNGDKPDWFTLKTFKLFGNHYFICKYAYNENGVLPRILGINIHDAVITDKNGAPRLERNPVINLSLFGLFEFHVEFYKKYTTMECVEKDVSMEYWEYMDEYLHYTHSLKSEAWWHYSSPIYWRYDFEEEKYVPYEMVVPTPFFSLNKKGKKKFAELK